MELKAALEEFEPGGLAGGCSEFGAEFFREVERHGVQLNSRGRQGGCEAV